MTDPARTAAGDLLKQAADAGVAPLLLLDGSPWAIRREVLPQLADAARWPVMAGMNTTRAATPAQPVTAGVAVIPLTGIITPQGSWLSMLYGGAPGGLCAFREAFAGALNSPDVSAILIDVDSPGGLCDLVPETAAEIRDARGTKPIVAIADTQMCSAAYWIASQADEVVITPSGYAGSIGVYRMHIDFSRANNDMGVAVTYVHAGKYKVEGNSDEPLGQEARDKWQSDVDDVYETFVADVAAGRQVSGQVVIDDYGQGRTMNARRALEAGLVDRVATYENVIDGLLGRAEPAGASATAVAAALLAQRRDGNVAAADLIRALEAAQLDARQHLLPDEQGRAPIGDEKPAVEIQDPSDSDAPALSAEDRAAIAAQLLAG